MINKTNENPNQYAVKKVFRSTQFSSKNYTNTVISKTHLMILLQ